MKLDNQLSKKRSLYRWITFGAAGLLVAALAACGGSGGSGETAAVVAPPPAAATGLQPPSAAAVAAASVADAETCSICHSSGAGVGAVAQSGFDHQAEYNKYNDASALSMTVDGVVDVANGDGTFTSTLTFTALKNGAGLTAAQIAALPQKTFYASSYDAATGTYPKSFSYTAGSTAANYTATGVAGQFTVKQAKAAFAPTANGQAYAYITENVLNTEGFALYSDVSNGAKAFGTAATTPYASNANVSACEKCHGTPYMKHGYRAAQVAGVSDFSACKNCHYDTRVGGHLDWQVLKDDPARYAAINAAVIAAKAAGDTTKDTFGENLTTAEKTKYAYTANVMNDVHMSHNMEFPYPQSMKNCATCHAGKLTTANGVLADSKFMAATCISCHSADGLAAKMKTNRKGQAITIHDAFVAKIQDGSDRTTNCQGCHSAATAFGPLFKDLHTGYNPLIYSDAAGTKYSGNVTVTIDKASVAANVLTIDFSAVSAGAAVDVSKIVPTVLVGLYGYDTKDFIVAAHGTNADGKRNLEWVVGAAHPRFKTVSAAGGKWQVTADLSYWATMIADGSIKRAEIAVLPTLGHATITTTDRSGKVIPAPVALDAPSKTFDLTKNAFDAAFFSDIVKVATGCNNCHDALATTFHTADRGGNIKVCRICHEASSAGGHLEMQSRSIDSYVHSIHSFQAFDIGSINFADPVEALEYEHHIGSTYPNFTIKNCQSCHNAGTFGVPDASKSLPGKLSAAAKVTTMDRAIGAVPSYVVGPASRACGGCHRAQMIKADDAGGLATFNSHTKTFGYLIEDATGVWDATVAKVMSIFK